MRSLLAATCLTPVSFLFAAAPLLAETVVSTAVTTPVLTGTLADNLRISSAGSVKPTSGSAVTINSNHTVKNEGAIAISNANNATGILANAGVTSAITNSGSIVIDETYAPTDTDSDGDIDGPLAQGSGRFGIHALGAFTGNIVNSGNITVEGNQSAAIALDGPLTGSLSSTAGTIVVVGNDSAGIRTADVSGNLSLYNTAITAIGANAVGVAVTGDVGGALTFQSSILASGYRYTTSPTDPSKLDSDDLLQGGPAVQVAGDVAGGILFDARPADTSTTDTDEDDDGIADSSEPNSTVTSLGSAPAVAIGSTTSDIAIGAVASSTAGHGLVVKGTVGGIGLYKGVAATGMAIGGTGHAVSIAGGMTLGGAILANSIEANATALRIGAGASVPAIQIDGSVSAAGVGTASTTARGVLIEAGANVGSLKVASGAAVLVSRNGTDGLGVAIADQSGTLALIENSGSISVSQAATLGDKAVAIDLSANAGGVIVRQLAVASNVAAPLIAGTMLFGSGSDLVDIADGSVTGAAKFGGGDNQLRLSGDSVMTGAVTFGSGGDQISLSGTASLTGNVDFGGGADQLQLAGASRFSGALANSAGLAVNVGAGSTLEVTNIGTVALSSLTTGAGSTLGVSLDGSTGAHTLFDISGAASFGSNTLVNVNLLSVGGVEGSYTIVDAGSLAGGGNLSSSVGLLPFLFTSSVSSDSLAGTVTLNVARKSAADLGINDSEAAALDSILSAVDQDSAVAGVFLDIFDSGSLSASIQQMLPEHAGGVFENVTKGSRLAARALADPNPPQLEGGLGVWLEQVAWGNSKSVGNTASYDLDGWGASGGIEHGLGSAGRVGVSLAYTMGKDNKDDNQIASDQVEAGVYWRGNFGPLNAYARGGVGHVSFDSTRNFTGLADGAAVTRSADAKWTGTLLSAGAGVSYEARIGRLTLRPALSLETFKLTEKGYDESGGGDGFNLAVAKRQSDETAATGLLTIGYDLMSKDPNEGWMRVELEGGRRQILSGSLGSTTASFANGDPFTLEPEQRESGLIGALRLAGGGSGMSVHGEVNAEERESKVGIGGRLGIAFSL